MSLAGKASGAPASGDTLESLTLGDSNSVDHLVLAKDSAYVHLLLEEIETELNLVRDGSSVDLNLHDVCLFLGKLGKLDLGVGNDADNGAVLENACLLGILVLFALVGGGFLGVLGECLFLGVVPVLVHAAFEGFAQVVSPDGGETAESAWGLNVPDEPDHGHWGCLEDGDSLDNLLLVGLTSRAVEFTHDVGHARLVRHEGGEVAWLGCVVAGELLDASAVAAAALAWQKA